MKLFSRHRFNERQIKILTDANLPTKWKELSYTQRKSIVAIEEMLQYLDKKYGKKFCYNGYIPENKIFFDEEELYAYAEGDDPDTDTFTVNRKDDGFEDGYQWVLVHPQVQKEMEERLAPIFEGERYKVFTTLLGVTDEGIVKSLDVCIYILDINREQGEKYIEQVVNLIRNDSMAVKIHIYCFDEGKCDWKGMNINNHQQCFNINDIKYMYYSSPATQQNSELGWEADYDR